MFATSARMVPLIASASVDSFAGTKLSLPSSFLTVTSGLSLRTSVPFAPLTVFWSAVIATSTPCGTAIGIFPTRDMSAPSSGLRDEAQDLAADAVLARLAVGHHALRRRDDGDAQAVHDLRDRVAALVDAQAGAADALDALDDGPAGVVLQRDLELALRAVGAHREAVDVALVLQHLRDRDLQLRRRHRDDRLLDELRIADARQHVGDGITHAHTGISFAARRLTSWP